MSTSSEQPVQLLSAINFPGLAFALVILIVTWFVARFFTRTLQEIGNRIPERRLRLNQGITLLRFIIFLVGVILAISSAVSLSKEVIIAITGTAAVTIGFALKDLAASVLAGIIIIMDRPFQVGDRVTFDGFYGEITAIGLRSVRLVTLDDSVITIPNNKFLTDSVSSGNWGALDMLVQMDFFIGVDQDISEAQRLVGEAMTASRFAYLQKPWVVLINQVIQQEYVAIRLRAKAYVLDVKYEKAFETDVTLRVMAAFRAHGIMPPAILHRSLQEPRLPASTPGGGIQPTSSNSA
ncbi:MAG: mechanosensitive ion channel family protein [Gammaproteobacteria bacterium]